MVFISRCDCTKSVNILIESKDSNGTYGVTVVYFEPYTGFECFSSVGTLSTSEIAFLTMGIEDQKGVKKFHIIFYLKLKNLGYLGFEYWKV